MTHQSAALRQGQAKASLSASQEAFPLYALFKGAERAEEAYFERSAGERAAE